MSDPEDEHENHSLFHDQFKIGEDSETPTVFIIPGDNEMSLAPNGRLDDSGESIERRPLYDDRGSDYEEDCSKERETLRSPYRENACSCLKCKTDRGHHDSRRNSDCRSYCSHHEHGSYHGECNSERCRHNKDHSCHSEQCAGSHCSKSNKHDTCHHHSYHGSHRPCHDPLCGGGHCHGSHCHGDGCYPKYDWRDYFMEEEEHRYRHRNSAVYKHMYDSRFGPSDRPGSRNPFDTYPRPMPDGMFIPPDPMLMDYGPRRGGSYRGQATKDKHHPADRRHSHPTGHNPSKKPPEPDLAPLDALSLTKNVPAFKGNVAGFEGDGTRMRPRGRRDILTAPGSAIRRMKELVSKYSDRQSKDPGEHTEGTVNRPIPPDFVDNEDQEMCQNDAAIDVKQEAYACHICGKEFAWAITLKRHMLIHTGIRQYQCTICNKAFTRSHHLKRHMTVHTGEKPYVCPVCQKAYSRSDRLSSHMNNHEGYVANKKRGRIPAKSSEETSSNVAAASTERTQDGAFGDVKDRPNESSTPSHGELDEGPVRDVAMGENFWSHAPPGLDNSGIVTSEIGRERIDILTHSRDEGGPMFSRMDTDRENTDAISKHVTTAEPEGSVKKEESNLRVIVRSSVEREVIDPIRREPDTLSVETDKQVPPSSSPRYSEHPPPTSSTSPFASFGLSKAEKDTLAKFKILSPDNRPAEYRPPEFFGPPVYAFHGPGPTFIPGNILDANTKDGKLPPFPAHGALFRPEESSPGRRSPHGHDDRTGLPFPPTDHSKFAFSSLLNARNEFINKQRMGQLPIFFQEPPHDVGNRNEGTRSEVITHPKSDDREAPFSADIPGSIAGSLPGSFLSSRKEDGPADDSKNLGPTDETSMQSRFKMQVAPRDTKPPSMEMAPPDPHMNLFTFRHMVQQPGRPRLPPDGNSQKRVLPRTFVCRTCNKGFTRSHHLRRHELIHSGQKPFKCTICGRAFNRSDHLNLHLATHYQSANGPRPYNRDSSKGKKKDGSSSETGNMEGEHSEWSETNRGPDGSEQTGMQDSDELNRGELPIVSPDFGMAELPPTAFNSADHKVSTSESPIKVESTDRFDINSSI